MTQQLEQKQLTRDELINKLITKPPNAEYNLSFELKGDERDNETTHRRERLQARLAVPGNHMALLEREYDKLERNVALRYARRLMLERRYHAKDPNAYVHVDDLNFAIGEENLALNIMYDFINHL